MKDDIKRFIRDHALEESPDECCGIIYQDENVMKIETLIGQLMIERKTIARVINQNNSYKKRQIRNTKRI